LIELSVSSRIHWLDYFVTGLEAQMIEVKQRGEKVIRRDVRVQKHGLNERQGKVLELLMQQAKLTIQDYEAAFPNLNRRTLQRDLKGLLDKKLINEVGAGATDPTRYYVMIKL
jgi:predicted HTH transcriptional regulator